MLSHPHSAFHPVPATGVPASIAAPCPIAVAAQVRVKALKKWRKQERLRFYNTGPDQLPGLVVMHIDGEQPRAYPDARYRSVAV
ncbi:MAG: DUF3372 domain-containing protein, partial [Hymenobacter sp.]